MRLALAGELGSRILETDARRLPRAGGDVLARGAARRTRAPPAGRPCRRRRSSTPCWPSRRAVVDRALVPIENSTEGAVGPTLDALAVETEDVRIVGEVVHADPPRADRRASRSSSSDVSAVLSHPQANAQCARFVRARAAAGRASSRSPRRAEAVRIVVEPATSAGGRARPALAAELHGGVVLRDGVEDEAANVTRFVWLAPAGTRAAGRRRRRPASSGGAPATSRRAGSCAA